MFNITLPVDFWPLFSFYVLGMVQGLVVGLIFALQVRKNQIEERNKVAHVLMDGLRALLLDKRRNAPIKTILRNRASGNFHANVDWENFMVAIEKPISVIKQMCGIELTPALEEKWREFQNASVYIYVEMCGLQGVIDLTSHQYLLVQDDLDHLVSVGEYQRYALGDCKVMVFKADYQTPPEQLHTGKTLRRFMQEINLINY
jgi:hypothetical protein